MKRNLSRFSDSAAAAAAAAIPAAQHSTPEVERPLITAPRVSTSNTELAAMDAVFSRSTSDDARLLPASSLVPSSSAEPATLLAESDLFPMMEPRTSGDPPLRGIQALGMSMHRKASATGNASELMPGFGITGRFEIPAPALAPKAEEPIRGFSIRGRTEIPLVKIEPKPEPKPEPEPAPAVDLIEMPLLGESASASDLQGLDAPAKPLKRFSEGYAASVAAPAADGRAGSGARGGAKPAEQHQILEEAEESDDDFELPERMTNVLRPSFLYQSRFFFAEVRNTKQSAETVLTYALPKVSGN